MTTSVIEAFKRRKQLSPTVTVTLEVLGEDGEPVEQFELTIGRMTGTEEGNVQRAAALAAASVDTGEAHQRAVFGDRYYGAVLPVLKRKTTAWVHTPPEGEQPVEFSQENLQVLFDNLSLDLQTQLVTKYFAALDAEREKAEGNVNTSGTDG